MKCHTRRVRVLVVNLASLDPQFIPALDINRGKDVLFPCLRNCALANIGSLIPARHFEMLFPRSLVVCGILTELNKSPTETSATLQVLSRTSPDLQSLHLSVRCDTQLQQAVGDIGDALGNLQYLKALRLALWPHFTPNLLVNLGMSCAALLDLEIDFVCDLDSVKLELAARPFNIHPHRLFTQLESVAIHGCEYAPFVSDFIHTLDSQHLTNVLIDRVRLVAAAELDGILAVMASCGRLESIHIVGDESMQDSPEDAFFDLSRLRTLHTLTHLQSLQLENVRAGLQREDIEELGGALPCLETLAIFPQLLWRSDLSLHDLPLFAQHLPHLCFLRIPLDYTEGLLRGISIPVPCPMNRTLTTLTVCWDWHMTPLVVNENACREVAAYISAIYPTARLDCSFLPGEMPALLERFVQRSKLAIVQCIVEMWNFVQDEMMIRARHDGQV